MEKILERPCRACRAPLRFVPGENGKLIPLDLRSQVYRVTTDLVGEPVAKQEEGSFVSHFQTCPKANDFSASKKGKTA